MLNYLNRCSFALYSYTPASFLFTHRFQHV